MDEETIRTLSMARHAAADCQRCPLYLHATQTVFGEGPDDAPVVFVGEQPGDREDMEGHPFVGPAGRLFDEMIGRVGIERSTVYVTNAVKHFKFEPRGKRRIHQRPDGEEIVACRFWLDIERKLLRPRVIVALGATAARSLLGRSGATISRLRGAPIMLEGGAQLFVTNHPSYLLRISDPESRRRERERFEADLVLVRKAMAGAEIPPPSHGGA